MDRIDGCEAKNIFSEFERAFQDVFLLRSQGRNSLSQLFFEGVTLQNFLEKFFKVCLGGCFPFFEPLLLSSH